MNPTLQERCSLFLYNRDAVKAGFRWESSAMAPLCALIFTGQSRKADIPLMKRCEALLKNRTGLFSNFRGCSKLAAIALLSLDAQPEQRLDYTLFLYEQLKREFYASSYLPSVALLLSGRAAPEKAGEAVARTKTIYRLMKERHPFLTEGKDGGFAALLALSDREDGVLIAEAERCYTLLRPLFSIGNGPQSLSHVLALSEQPAEEKCRRVGEISGLLASYGCQYGRTCELPALGVLSLLPYEPRSLAAAVVETDAFLRAQRGFGAFGTGACQRRMYAAMLVTSDAVGGAENPAVQTAAINAAIALQIAQDAALIAAVTAANAAAAAGAASSSAP